MSVIIQGIDMPENCLECPCFNSEFVVCNVVGIDLSVYHTLHKDCPLVEIPTPHGRLIDVDDFIEVCEMLADKNDDRRPFEQAEWIAKDIITILEAEGGDA